MALLRDLSSNTRLPSIRPSSIFQRGSPRNPSATTASAADRGNASPPRSRSAFEIRISLVLALASQASSVSQRVLENLAKETAKYAFPRRYEARNLEEA